MQETSDSLVKKAEALDFQVKRGEISLKDAVIILEKERNSFIKYLTDKIEGTNDE